MSENPLATEDCFPIRTHRLELRVRYQETDAQGRCHHANYINFFEVGRVEMLRSAGVNYRDLEAQGIFLVVTEVMCNYLEGARYDDLLTVETNLEWAKGVRIKHNYRILQNEKVMAHGHSIVAAVSPEGKVLRLPKWLRS
ncbi:MAG: thioesterase family protein [Pirellulaceae bacterium]